MILENRLQHYNEVGKCLIESNWANSKFIKLNNICNDFSTNPIFFQNHSSGGVICFGRELTVLGALSCDFIATIIETDGGKVYLYALNK